MTAQKLCLKNDRPDLFQSSGALRQKRRAETHSALTLFFRACLLALLLPLTVPAELLHEKDLEFFEKRIRPILVERCYECHGPDKQKGGLRLDHRAGVLEGGETGPALIPERPEESLMIQAILYRGLDLHMPPKSKLPDGEIEALTEWVKRGAPDPRGGLAAPSKPVSGIDIEAGREFWSYQLPEKTEPPSVKNSDWARTEIDRFILAKLEEKGLIPVRPADAASLLRRVYYDLTGLPPTPEQMDEYLADEAPEAWARLVDRLLASPHFGERWGRHWLDVARFGESVTLRGLIFREAWRYRDYVIDAFNRDLPYDRFVIEQIAGDLLPSSSLEERRRQMIATTFLVLGNTNLEEQDKQQLRMDVVDEQLDTIGKTFMGQTIGCARCHDHKFDPIPARDYYALAGILRNAKAMIEANVSNWIELPLPLDPEHEKEVQAQEQAVAGLQEKIKAAKQAAEEWAIAAGWKAPKQAPVVKATDLPGVVLDDSEAKQVGEWQHSQFSGRYIGSGFLHDQNNGKGKKTLTFQPELPQAGVYEVRLAYVPGSNRSTATPVTVFSADGEKTVLVNQRETPRIDGRFVSLGNFRFEQNSQGFVLVSNEGTDGHVIADAVQFLPLDRPIEPKLVQGVATEKVAAAQQAAERVKELENELKDLRASIPPRPMVMTVQEEEKPGDTYVHIRGSVHNKGPVTPRGFLQVASYGALPEIPKDQSGRRELAEWIASESHPLTARVMVNRVWHWLFGAGLVRTTENFGTTGEMPSHPELLDYLAVRFMEEGWSVKTLIREIVTSEVYQLSTEPSVPGLAADPENRWLWRMNRRRLEAESIRDTLLFVSGQLKFEMGESTIKPGVNADYGYVDSDTRRSVYVPVLRNALPELFELFDFADPSMVTGRRNSSTVAPQALFLLNHPFVLEQARLAAERMLSESAWDAERRIERVYRRVLARAPGLEEKTIALSFVSEMGGNELEAWAQLYQALFASIDFRYLD